MLWYHLLGCILLLVCSISGVVGENRRLTSGRLVSTIVGSGTAGTGGGTGTSAQLNSPHDVLLSSSSEFAFIADYDNHAIRRYSFSTGTVIFFAGSTSAVSGTADGTGTSARFNRCKGLVMHPSGDYFFVTDQANHRIRKVEVATGVVSTVAGSSTAGQTDGTGTSATFNDPWGIVIDSAGSFLIVTSTNRIRRIALPSYEVTTVAGGGPGYKDSVGTSAQFFGPSGMAMSPDDSYVLVADRENNAVRSISLHNNKVTHFCGLTTAGHVDGDCDTTAQFQSLVSISFSADGSYVLIGGGLQNTIRKIDISTKIASTLAGSTTSGSTNGVLSSARFSYPVGFAMSSDGSFALVADKSNHMIRHIMLVEPTASPTSAPSVSPTLTPTAAPTRTPTLQPSGFPSYAPTLMPTVCPTFFPTSLPTSTPTSSSPTIAQPTAIPTTQPSGVPSNIPTGIPTSQPTEVANDLPTSRPTGVPTTFPSSIPTSMPTSVPSSLPSSIPTSYPTAPPSSLPTSAPTSEPSSVPSSIPTSLPTMPPTSLPTSEPSSSPTSMPSSSPTAQPTSNPTIVPTSLPSASPSSAPSTNPSGVPSSMPSSAPSSDPTSLPTALPTSSPSATPTSVPSTIPTTVPSAVPSEVPTSSPTSIPTSCPTSQPTAVPSSQPSSHPTAIPSSQPSSHPTAIPSSQPSSHPTAIPSSQPSSHPTAIPSSQPSSLPTAIPSSQPSSRPTAIPSSQPSSQPTAIPSSQPSSHPTAIPSSQPSSQPTRIPTTLPTARPTHLPTYFPTSSETYAPLLLNDITYAGYIIHGAAIHGSTFTAASAGDINADGIDDVIVGCPFYKADVGAAYVIFGKSGGSPDIYLNAINHKIGYAVFGSVTGGLFGYTVSGAGDIDGDGVGDIVISAPYGNEGSGFVYVLYGAEGYRNDIYITTLTLSTGFVISGSSMGGNAGLFLANVGDVTGDGLADILLSEPYSNSMTGASYLIYGQPRNNQQHVVLDQVGGSMFTVFVGSKIGAKSGFEIAAVGDVNGDGAPDFAIGEPHTNDFSTGSVRVIYGCFNHCYGNAVNLASLGSRGYSIVGAGKYAKFGMVIHGAGDINKDGYDDFMLGSVAGGNFLGVVYVVYGQATPNSLSLANFRSVDGFSVTGAGTGNFGSGAVGNVDINHDGSTDLLILNSYASIDEIGYAIVDTQSLRQGGSRKISDMTSHHMFPLRNSGYDTQRIYAAGDVDHNGYNDFIVTSTKDDLAVAFVIYDIYNTDPPEPSSHSPVISPTRCPTFRPSFTPTLSPTNRPTQRPTAPTCKPTFSPTAAPNATPQPTRVPTQAPSAIPSLAPTVSPTFRPTSAPSRKPTRFPTLSPTVAPSSSAPSTAPSSFPTSAPNQSQQPTSPTLHPTHQPTPLPTALPTMNPARSPTASPTCIPTFHPSQTPTPQPSVLPTMKPTRHPTLRPTVSPTVSPTLFPTTRHGFAVISASSCDEYVGTYADDWFIVDPGDKCSLNISGNGGSNVFAIMPAGETSITIKDFSLSNDRLDLTSFSDITSFKQLNMTKGSVLIHLQAGQVIVLLHHDPADMRPEHFVFVSSSSSSSEIALSMILFILLLGLLVMFVGSMLKNQLNIEFFGDDMGELFNAGTDVLPKITHRKAFLRVAPTSEKPVALHDSSSRPKFTEKSLEHEMKERDRCETYDSYLMQEDDMSSTSADDEMQHHCNYALYLLSQRRGSELENLDDSMMPDDMILDVSSESDGVACKVEYELVGCKTDPVAVDPPPDHNSGTSYDQELEDDEYDASSCSSRTEDNREWRDLSSFHAVQPRYDDSDDSYYSGSTNISLPINSQISSESDLPSQHVSSCSSIPVPAFLQREISSESDLEY